MKDVNHRHVDERERCPGFGPAMPGVSGFSTEKLMDLVDRVYTTSGPLAPLSLPAGQVRDFRRRDSEEVVTHLVPNSCHAGSPWNARGAPKALRNGDRCVRHHGQTSLFSFIGNAMGSARARRF